MLEEKDIQAIGEIFDQRIKTSLDERIGEILDQKIKTHLDEKIGEVLVVVNEGFNGIQEQINDLREDISKRPTKDEIFSWADKRITPLDIASERHDFLHIDELSDLPSAAEISKALVEKGVKDRFV